MQVGETTIEQRILVMRELAESAWALLGRPLPEYSRENMPGRVVRIPEGA